MDAFTYFMMFLITITSIGSLVFIVTQSFVMNKMYEILKIQQERQAMEDEARLRARGLVDLQDASSYPLRLR